MSSTMANVEQLESTVRVRTTDALRTLLLRALMLADELGEHAAGAQINGCLEDLGEPSDLLAALYYHARGDSDAWYSVHIPRSN